MSHHHQPARPLAATITESTRTELINLLEFSSGAQRPGGGFGLLDNYGTMTPDAPIHALQTARMTFTFAIGSLFGLSGTTEPAADGVNTLQTLLRDHEYGGTFSDPTRPDAAKTAYLACFVALAASAAVRAQIPGADTLLEHAARDLLDHFWSEPDGLIVDEWDRQFQTAAPYRGANANMHAVETFCAVGGALRDADWYARATRIAERFIDGAARDHSWLMPEHFDDTCTPLLEYNYEEPSDEFRPYGVTIGHLFEWSRLLLELDTVAPSAWLRPASHALYTTAKRHGWYVDGRPGFVYTIGWDRAPVVRSRPHWATLEAICAAATQWQTTADAEAQTDLEMYSDYAERYLRDRRNGSWHHELDTDNRPIARMWHGKPDAYHALGAILIPELPLAASLADRVLGTQHAHKPKEEPSWSPL